MSTHASTTDLLNTPVTDDETRILDVYESLKTLVAADSLPPSAAANLRDALASVSIVVTGQLLDYEQLLDLNC